MNTNELVSIIVPCYNYAAFLSDCLKSLIRQSYSNWECIVVDDGSADETREIVAEFAGRDPRFRYLFQENKGMSCARNFALSRAAGTLIQFVDADDLLEVDKLRVHVCSFAANSDTDLVYGDWDYFSHIGYGETPVSAAPIREPWKPRTSGAGVDLCRDLIIGNIFTISAPLVRKSLLDQICGFDESLNSHEDWDLWLRCALVGGRFRYYDALGARTLIRLHPTSVSRNLRVMLQTDVLVRKKVHSQLSETSLIDLNHRLTEETEVVAAVEEIKHGVRVAGFARLLRCCFSCYGFSKIKELVLYRLRSNVGIS